MPSVKACLVDVYDTILTASFRDRQAIFANLIGVPLDEWVTQWLATARDRDLRLLTMAQAFAGTLAACGREPEPSLVDRLVAMDEELLIDRTTVFEDTAPFLTAVRAEGIPVVLVSNCAENTRGMLAATGVLDLADAAILSCEVGVGKPDPEIYQIALREAGVLAADAVFLDDQPAFCEGALAIGVRAIQVVRPGFATRPADPRFTPVSSLAEVLPLL